MCANKVGAGVRCGACLLKIGVRDVETNPPLGAQSIPNLLSTGWPRPNLRSSVPSSPVQPQLARNTRLCDCHLLQVCDVGRVRHRCDPASSRPKSITHRAFRFETRVFRLSRGLAFASAALPRKNAHLAAGRR